MGQRYNTGRGVSLQEEIDFEDDIHQETDAQTQLADGYGEASQGLYPPDHRQAIKARVVVISSQSVSFVHSNESFWHDFLLLSNFHFHGID